MEPRRARETSGNSGGSRMKVAVNRVIVKVDFGLRVQYLCDFRFRQTRHSKAKSQNRAMISRSNL
jgi:hypothetical protein